RHHVERRRLVRGGDGLGGADGERHDHREDRRGHPRRDPQRWHLLRVRERLRHREPRERRGERHSQRVHDLERADRRLVQRWELHDRRGHLRVPNIVDHRRCEPRGRDGDLRGHLGRRGRELWHPDGLHRDRGQHRAGRIRPANRKRRRRHRRQGGAGRQPDVHLHRGHRSQLRARQLDGDVHQRGRPHHPRRSPRHVPGVERDEHEPAPARHGRPWRHRLRARHGDVRRVGYALHHGPKRLDDHHHARRSERNGAPGRGSGHDILASVEHADRRRGQRVCDDDGVGDRRARRRVLRVALYNRPMQVLDSFLDAVGRTPLVRLRSVTRGVRPTILAKLEMLNPGGSVKDRIGLRMIESAERAGLLRPGGTIVEPTSGNTGHGLAIAAAIKGYKCIFVMPDKMSQEKVALLRAYGAEVVITPTAVAPESPESYYRVADRLTEEIPGAFQPNQYFNQENPQAHYETTGPEIWNQTDGRIDVLVVGVGTGGTVTGTARYLKEQKPDLLVVGADPEGSLFSASPDEDARPYLTEGIGEDFWPKTLDPTL